MKKHLFTGYDDFARVFCFAGCGEVPPTTSANAQSALTAFPAPCQTLPAGQAADIRPQYSGHQACFGDARLPGVPAGDRRGSADLSLLPGDTKWPGISHGAYNPGLGLLNEAPVAPPYLLADQRQCPGGVRLRPAWAGGFERHHPEIDLALRQRHQRPDRGCVGTAGHFSSPCCHAGAALNHRRG